MMKSLVFNKQIILAAGMIVFIVAAVIGGTGAFFSDTESSTGNVFTAGSVSLQIKDLTHDYSGDELNAPNFEFDEDGFTFELDDIKPLDEGTISYDLENGANEAHVCVLVENATTAPEANDTALGSMLNFLFGEVSGIAGIWQSLGILDAEELASLDIDYCFGVYDDGSCVLDDVDYNPAQNGQMVVDIDFYAVQTRNNEGFDCDSLNNDAIGNSDLFTVNDRPAAYASKKWFFYNDTNDTIMSLNQFGPTGENEIEVGPGGVEAAKMVLHDATGRYNIATYRFNDVKLADISTMKYRIYDASVSGETPYLNFNIDFNNTDTWQRRLVQVPAAVVANTWTEVDALAGMWTLSGGNWPVGTTELGATPGSTPKTWTQILAEYPIAETRSTDSFFGIRVGHPGPVAETSYVDWVEFDGVKYNFAN